MMNLFRAFKPILGDLLSTILFVAILSATGSVVIATCCGIATGIGQIAYLALRKLPIARMQWASLALVIVLGGATLLTHDARFVMIKPTIGNISVGLIMLQPYWMGRYMPAVVTDHLPRRTIVLWGYIWAAAMFLLAAANLYCAFVLGQKAWSWYVAVVPTSVQLGLFALNYLSIRLGVRAHMRVAAADAAMIGASS
jgi:intracellular septation protein